MKNKLDYFDYIIILIGTGWFVLAYFTISILQAMIGLGFCLGGLRPFLTNKTTIITLKIISVALVLTATTLMIIQVI